MGVRKRDTAAATATLHTCFFGSLAYCVQPGRHTHSSGADTALCGLERCKVGIHSAPRDWADVMDGTDEDEGGSEVGDGR